MKAIVQDRYGLPEVLDLREMDRPVPAPDEVLIRVHAASVAAGDHLLMTGRPAVMRLGWGLKGPRKNIPGFDIAGRVEEIGAAVTEFSPGDAVFGNCSAACAEYAVASENSIAPKPQSMDFEQAAPLTVSGVTALRMLRDCADVQPGQKVLINGASGGVGTYAVQVGKVLGAEVTAVCSAGNADLMRSIGADHVIDYATEDFTRGDERYDVILDNVGNHPLSACRRVLTGTGVLLSNSGTVGGKWFGPLGRMLGALIASLFTSRQGRPMEAKPSRADLMDLRGLVDGGLLTTVVGAAYPLDEVPEAMAYIGTGHARGKVVITI